MMNGNHLESKHAAQMLAENVGQEYLFERLIADLQLLQICEKMLKATSLS